MAKRLFLLGFYLGVWLVILQTTFGLDIQEAEEGSCEILKTEPQARINMTWIGSIQNWYVNAGSKYHLYRIVHHHLGDDTDRLEDLPDYSFYYKACISFNANLSADTSLVTVRALEPGLASYHVTQRIGHGVIDFRATNSSNVTIQSSGDVVTSRHYITLTDNRSFIFFTNCDSGSNMKSWDIFSTTARLSSQAIRRIEEHAMTQGFDKKKFVFLRYDSCSRGMNLGTETNRWSYKHGRDFGPRGHHSPVGQGPYDLRNFGPGADHGQESLYPRGRYGLSRYASKFS